MRTASPLSILLPVLLAGGADLLPAGPAVVKDGAPEGWEARIGATSGTDRPSEVLPGPEGGVLLRGTAGTGQWRLLARPFDVEEGGTVRLSFEARASGLRREPRQFEYAWVAAAVPLPGGKAVDRRFVHLADRGWTPEEIVFRAPAAGKAEAWIFLSKSGAVEVRSMAAEPLRPEDSYDALVRHMGRYYSHFASKGIDWPGIAAARREAALAAKDEAGFVAAVRGLLAELKDIHVVIRRSDGKTIPTFVNLRARNADLRAVRGKLADPASPGGISLAGTAGKDLGYLAVFSLPQSEAEFAPVLEALDGMLDRRGLLLDLRGCTGGNERRALEMAAYFAKGRTVYARTRVRSGPAPADLSPPADRVLEPRAGRRFEGPVVCLLGPGCVSSGEGFAQMLAAIPGVVTVGQPTAGFSGNPAPVDLPNGVSVGFSRWVDLLPDGTPLEGRGVVPARTVEHTGPGDPTFDAGLAILEGMARGGR